MYKYVTLPIAPHWNWNSGLYRCRWQTIATNRTTLELKLIRPLCCVTINQSTNRTTLELKHGLSQKDRERVALPIAPHWNWNLFHVRKCLPRCWLPIAPHWNWNMFSIFRKYCGKQTTNRTTLELKQDRLIEFDFLQIYQSHHTGIETLSFRKLETLTILPIAPHWNWNPDFKESIFFALATNRTTLELKLCKKLSWYVFMFYQSHHTGIETMFSDLLRIGSVTTNRTTLELKQW